MKASTMRRAADVATRNGSAVENGEAIPRDVSSARTAAAGPDPEVAEKPERRRFTADYKLRILRAADACVEAGQLGALLRREGLYASNLTAWRRQRELGTLAALAPKKRGRPGQKPHPLARRVTELERENERLRSRLQQAEAIIEVQKKVSTLLGIPLNHPDTGGSA